MYAYRELLIQFSVSRLFLPLELVELGPQVAGVNLCVTACHRLQDCIMDEYILVLLEKVMIYISCEHIHFNEAAYKAIKKDSGI